MTKNDFIKQIEPVFNVILYEPNQNKMISYNIMPYFINEYNNKKGKPKTMQEFIDFIKAKSLYMFWSRCQFEIILTDWPCKSVEEKWDVHRQILMNLNTIALILYKAVKYK